MPALKMEVYIIHVCEFILTPRPMQVLWQVDTILFSLLIQRGLCDSQGRVWRNHSTQLYAIEVTLPEVVQYITKHGSTWL